MHLSETASAVILIGGVASAIGVIGAGVIWLVKPRLVEALTAELKAELAPMKSQVDETHKQVTVNHHSSEKPTVLDILDDLRADLRAQIQGVDRRLDQHLLASSKESAAMWSAMEAIAKAQPPPDL